MTKVAKFTAAAALTALTLTAMVSPSEARIIASGNNPANFTFAATSLLPINGAATSISFNVNKAGRGIVTFSAECAVNAAAGTSAAWIDIDVRMNGVAIAPTIGTADAFCSSNGTAGIDAYVRASITLVVPLVVGNNSLTVQGRLNNGATGGWIGDTAVVVER